VQEIVGTHWSVQDLNRRLEWCCRAIFTGAISLDNGAASHVKVGRYNSSSTRDAETRSFAERDGGVYKSWRGRSHWAHVR
jgi:hypothetical protein